MNETTINNNTIDNTINTITTTKKQRKSPAKAKKEKLPLIATIDNDNTFINLDSEFKWTQKLTDSQRLFVFYYCNQSLSKRNAAAAVKQAGYSKKTANVQAVKFLRTPEILAEIKNITPQILKNLTKTNIVSAVNEIIERKIKRLNMRPEDYYDIEMKTTPEGYEYISATMKTPDELTEAQKELIEDIEYVGQRSIPHYKLPSKTQTENELLKIHKEMQSVEDNGNDFDIETTAEIIGEKLQVKTKILKQNRETAEMSELAAIGAITREEED